MTAGDPVTSTTEIPKTSRTRRRRRFGSRRPRDQRGAALVEFALIATPLFLILFGTIEFGWAFFQLNDIRHGSREGVRVVVVNQTVNPDYNDAEHGSAMTATEKLAQETCERMDQKDGVVVQLIYSESEPAADTNDLPEVGDDVQLRTLKRLDQLTMAFDAVLGSVVIDETITSRLEQNPPAGVTSGVLYPTAPATLPAGYPFDSYMGWMCR